MAQSCLPLSGSEWEHSEALGPGPRARPGSPAPVRFHLRVLAPLGGLVATHWLAQVFEQGGEGGKLP